MKAIIISVEIEGASDFRFNQYTDEAQGEVASGKSGGKKHSVADRQRVAETLCFKNEQGLFLPARMVKKCMLNGFKSSRIQERRRSLEPLAKATVYIEPKEIPLGKAEPDYYETVVVRRPPKTGTNQPVLFPFLKARWRVSFAIKIFDPRITEDHVREALIEGGSIFGVGDGRPEYGRFVITKWNGEEIDND